MCFSHRILQRIKNLREGRRRLCTRVLVKTNLWPWCVCGCSVVLNTNEDIDDPVPIYNAIRRVNEEFQGRSAGILVVNGYKVVVTGGTKTQAIGVDGMLP